MIFHASVPSNFGCAYWKNKSNEAEKEKAVACHIWWFCLVFLSFGCEWWFYLMSLRFGACETGEEVDELIRINHIWWFCLVFLSFRKNNIYIILFAKTLGNRFPNVRSRRINKICCPWSVSFLECFFIMIIIPILILYSLQDGNKYGGSFL